jgi:outer membrane protein OmpA-like peptidoglycan-associated protein
MVLSDGKGNLSYSKKEGSVWSTPVPFQYNGTGSNAAAGSQGINNREGYFDETTSTMYFSSNRPGGQGGFDIWKSELNGKGWSEPVNAGAMVNTSGDEVTPSTNGVQLLFSSNGWPGLGGQDAFVWQPGMVGPANMLRGVNSSSNDTGARVGADGKGFVSSNRAGGKGGYDVYQFKADPAKIMAANKGAGVSGDNGIADSEDYIPYGSVVGDLEGMAEDGEMLELEIAEPAGSPVADAYRIVNGKLVTRKTVFTKDSRLRTVTIRGKDSRGRIITKVVEIWPAADKESGDWVIRLYYGSGKTGFREISFADANRVVRMLRSDPSLNLKIDIYTDCTGTEPVNLRVSKNRAVWLVNYLNRRVPGSAGRIQATGHGETNLLVDCGCDGQALRCTRAQNNKNRRAEIRRVK